MTKRLEKGGGSTGAAEGRSGACKDEGLVYNITTAPSRALWRTDATSSPLRVGHRDQRAYVKFN
eukprot:9390797-Alexandrium_andersonii.AAC.1